MLRQPNPFGITIAVEEAAGSASAPTVTPDYVRTLRVDVAQRTTEKGCLGTLAPAS